MLSTSTYIDTIVYEYLILHPECLPISGTDKPTYTIYKLSETALNKISCSILYLVIYYCEKSLYRYKTRGQKDKYKPDDVSEQQ